MWLKLKLKGILGNFPCELNWREEKKGVEG